MLGEPGHDEPHFPPKFWSETAQGNLLKVTGQ